MKSLFPILALCLLLSGSCNRQSDRQKIENALAAQLERFPESRLQDIYKNFYQDCFGTGHAISDTAMVFRYLANELQNAAPSDFPKIEKLGWRNNFVRISIDALRDGAIDTAALVNAFVQSASLINPADTANWTNEWHTVCQIIEEKHLPVKDYTTDKAAMDSILRLHPKAAFHHSAAFNQHYNPHYRVVKYTLYCTEIYF
ncbi:MAG: hypothetical protein LBN23_08415 [Paludibacter sp.]|jgi:hypothetical protein|nr:hypothetical protein [Paludibacter sp.]